MNLADGSMWSIDAGDKQASFLVSRFQEVMQLRPACKANHRLRVLVENHRLGSAFDDDPSYWAILPSNRDNSMTCILRPPGDSDILALQLIRLSLSIGLQVQTRGGLLLHGALAELKGNGVILAGPGGVGKTTASRRLKPPWRSLSDDLTLVVRDDQGRRYWAHPWPTWSTFMSGGTGGTWDVQQAVPLKSIFFLTQAHNDQVEPVGAAQAVCLLVKSAEQAWGGMPRNLDKEQIRTIHLERFENICTLAKNIPCYHLRLSLTGTFWREIEKLREKKHEN